MDSIVSVLLAIYVLVQIHALWKDHKKWKAIEATYQKAKMESEARMKAHREKLKQENYDANRFHGEQHNAQSS